MRVDLHVHTIHSRDEKFGNIIDAFNTHEDIRRRTKEEGLDGVAITDHNTIKGALRFSNYLSQYMAVIIGEEIVTKSCDVIALGLDTEIKPGLSLEETFDLIKKYNGIIVADHPFLNFLFFKGIGGEAIKRYRNKIDAVEVLNPSCSTKQNILAYDIANKLRMSKVAGSDAHFPSEIGLAYTIVDADSEVIEIVHAIKRGEAVPFGKPMPWRLRLERERLRFRRKL